VTAGGRGGFVQADKGEVGSVEQIAGGIAIGLD